jgi:hypothetical protein
MTVSASLDVALGLAFVFLLFALAVSKINETIATALNLRHKGLENALRALVGTDKGTAANSGSGQLSIEKVLGHNLVQPLQAVIAPGRFLKPLLGRREKGISYLPARTFSATVLDLLAPVDQPDPKAVLDPIAAAGLSQPAQLALTAAQADPDLPHVQALAGLLPAGDEQTKVQQLVVELRNDPLERAAAAVAGLGDNPARQPLMRMLADAQGDRERFRQSLEHWYDDTMDRVSGWYKRYVQRIILIISIVLVASLNVDSINIAQTLWRLPTERTAVAAAAAAHPGNGSSPSESADQQIRDIAALKLPLGWSPPHHNSAVSTDPQHLPLGFAGWLIKLLGLALTILALSLGAPFWFDALTKLGSLRQSGPKPTTSAHS